MDWVQLEWFEVPLVLVDLALEARMVVEAVEWMWLAPVEHG